MKMFFACFLMSITLFLSAQDDSLPVPLRYCELTVVRDPSEKNEQIKLEFMQDSTTQATWVQRGFFDEDGNCKKFNRFADALNWIEAQGWDFVSVFSNPAEGRYVNHYLMRKKIKL